MRNTTNYLSDGKAQGILYVQEVHAQGHGWSVRASTSSIHDNAIGLSWQEALSENVAG